MAWNTTDLFPTWGESGEQPPANFRYTDGDLVNEKHLDYLWSSLYSLENETWTALSDIDGDSDGRVDAAETAALVKDNDIDSNNDGIVDAADNATETFKNTDLDTDYVNASDQGVVATGDAGLVYVDELQAGNSLHVFHASLTGASSGAPTGTSLRIVTLDGSGGGTDRDTILNGDGSMRVGLTQTPLASWENTTGADVTVAVVLDNGHFAGGTGSAEELFGSIIARTV